MEPKDLIKQSVMYRGKYIQRHLISINNNSYNLWEIDELLTRPIFTKLLIKIIKEIQGLKIPLIPKVQYIYKEGKGWISSDVDGTELILLLQKKLLDNPYKISLDILKALNKSLSLGLNLTGISPEDIIVDKNKNIIISNPYFLLIPRRLSSDITGIPFFNFEYNPPSVIKGAPPDSKSLIYSWAILTTEIITGLKPNKGLPINDILEGKINNKSFELIDNENWRAILIDILSNKKDLSFEFIESKLKGENKQKHKHLLGNRYRKISLIGEGGMAKVYLGYDERLKRKVAIKEIKVKIKNSDIFLKEALLSAQLNHPNIVTVHDAFSEQGTLYIIMEYVMGVTLDTLIKNGSITINRGIEIIKQLLQGIAYAHSKGVLHLDIKPSNIFIDENSTVKIGDFGLSSVIGIEKDTKEHHFMGTPSYMAPEQINTKKVDERTDLFSIGLVLYEILTREPLFKGETITSTIYKVLNKKISLKKTPNRIKPILKKALSRDKNKRFQSAEEFYEAISYKETAKTTVNKKKTAVIISFFSILAIFGFLFFLNFKDVIFTKKIASLELKENILKALDNSNNILWNYIPNDNDSVMLYILNKEDVFIVEKNLYSYYLIKLKNNGKKLYSIQLPVNTDFSAQSVKCFLENSLTIVFSAYDKTKSLILTTKITNKDTLIYKILNPGTISSDLKWNQPDTILIFSGNNYFAGNKPFIMALGKNLLLQNGEFPLYNYTKDTVPILTKWYRILPGDMTTARITLKHDTLLLLKGNDTIIIDRKGTIINEPLDSIYSKNEKSFIVQLSSLLKKDISPDSILTILKNYKVSPYFKSAIYIFVSHFYKDFGEINSEKQLLQKALKIEKNLIYPRRRLLFIYMKEKQYKKAIKISKPLLKSINYNDIQMITDCYLILGLKNEALSIIEEKYNRMKEPGFEISFLYARILFLTGEIERSNGILETLVKNFPEYIESKMLLFETYAFLKTNSNEYLEKIKDLERSDPELQKEYGYVKALLYLKKHWFRSALRSISPSEILYEDFSRHNPHFLIALNEVYFIKALIYKKLGNRKKYNEYIKKCKTSLLNLLKTKYKKYGLSLH